MTFVPYLFFDGTCREAMTTYADVLGGRVVAMMTYDDAPDDEEMPDVPKDLVMHAAIMVGDALLMASDDMPGKHKTPASTHVHFSLLDFPSAETAFSALAEGGEVTMPFQKTFWTPGFGSLVDKWGTPWMISVHVEHEG